MKVGILTIIDYTNYGNRLQNYAMYRILKKKFHCRAVTVEAIDQKRYSDGNCLLWIKQTISRILCAFPSYVEKRFGNNVTRWANFTNWSKLIPTKHYYSSSSLPKKVDDKFDLFIAGSDQIWNYHFSAHRFADYFLTFTEDKKKNAVSASFGVDSIPAEWRDTYIKGLRNFENISVREDAGRNIIKDLLGLEVPVLIDPTMMLSKKEWLKVSKKPRVDCSCPYVLKYYLGDENEKDRIDLWAKENGYEVYELLNDQIPELYSAGPGEFISLIHNAALVCSDSFHCIVFSIIFSKPFLVYERQGSGNYMTSRLDTLLKKFGFENRWIHLVEEKDYLNCDHTHVPQLLEKERKYFMDYIENVLNEYR